MFSLDTWVTNINLAKIIRSEIETMTKSKHDLNSTHLKLICCEYLYRNYASFYKIYTDGSKDGMSIGAAFYDPYEQLNMRFKICANISIMETELIAIAEALSYVDSTNLNRVVILTDSKSSLQHLARCTSTFRGTPIAYSIIDTILKLQQKGISLVLQWIPSHIGIDGNEKVDSFAKLASSEGVSIKPSPFYSNHIPWIKQQNFDLFKEYFDIRSREKGIWYRTIQPQPMRYPWIDNSSLNRVDTVTALRLRTGHIPCNKFSYLMRKTPSPSCPDCNMIDDAYHIVMECVRNKAKRDRFGLKLEQLGECNIILAEPLSVAARMMYQLVDRN